jgi:hypothetical protein
MNRSATFNRATTETQIKGALTIDGMAASIWR